MIKLRIFALRLLIIPALLLGLSGCRIIGSTVGMIIPLALRLAPLKLMMVCIPEGTAVDTPNGPRPIEMIRPGDNVIGFEGRTVRVLQIHAYAEDPTAERFLRVGFENGAIVQLCDMHRIDGIRSKNLKLGDRIDDQTVKSIVIYGGVERSYDLLTEDDGYQISGLPVNSMIEEMIATSKNGTQSIRP
ncbi:MAG: hypothetical protein GXP30_06745 [Verrucomicrobia bacterium]|nr:hypothetical protein [Verrucomicrobiota bacterium]